MNVETISLAHLAYTLIPVIVVLLILFKWQLKITDSIYAISRMLAQLLLVGYFLNTLFAFKSGYLVVMVLTVMLLISSWIALNTVKKNRRRLFFKAVLALFVSTGLTLSIIIFGVLDLNPWYAPRYVIPLGGMILANAMNSISLAAERFQAEIDNHRDMITARNIAFNAALIPTINSLLAVGLVALPGMMTGQILSGISPFIAARYQIMVMCMIFSSSGISAACFLTLIQRDVKN